MQAPLRAADEGKVWLRTETGKYVQMAPDTRRKVLANQASVVEQFCPHGLPLPEAHEDELERAKVAAMKAEFMASEVERTAAVAVRLVANLQPVEAKVARFGAQSCALPDAVALRAIPPLADSELRNAPNLNGAVAVVERGGNAFVDKALRVQAAGAVGMIVINTEDAPYVPLGSPAGGDEGVHIPVVCVQRREGARFRNPANVALEFGGPVDRGDSDSRPAGDVADGDTSDESSDPEHEDEGTAEVMPPDPTAVSFLVTVPEGQRPGSRMVVTAPDGRSVAIDVPVDAVAGQQLQVNLPAAIAGAMRDDDDESYDEYEDEDEYTDEYTDEEELDEEEDDDEDQENDLDGAGVGFSPKKDQRPSGREHDEVTPTTTDDTGADQSRPEAVDEQALPQTFLVTLPEGIESGQQIRVQAPDGRSAVITVPEGISAGQQLRVQLPPEKEKLLPADSPAEAETAEGTGAGAASQAGLPSSSSSSTTPLPSPGPAKSGAEEVPSPRAPEPEPQPQLAQPSSVPAPAPAPPQQPLPPTDSAADVGTTLAVVVPDGVTAGQQLRVQAPDGRQAMITVPDGVKPGQQLKLTLPPATPTPRPQPQPAATPTSAAPSVNGSGERQGTGAGTDTPRQGQGVGWGKTQLAPPATNPPQPADAASSGGIGRGTADADHASQVLSTNDPEVPELAPPSPGASQAHTAMNHAPRSTVSSLPPAEAGKHWYRDTDGELRQLTVAQRRIAMVNLQEQGMAGAPQVDDSGAALPVPPELEMELRAIRNHGNDGLLSWLWSYATGEDLLPPNPQFPIWT